MKENNAVGVIGGMNMDIGGRPRGRLLLKDSNPGQVSVRPGGVGRNIAHNLRLLGLPVALVSAVGEDDYGRALLRSCGELGIDCAMTLVLPGERSSTYLYITDEDGDMQLAVSDMDITGRIGPEHIRPLLPRLNRAPAVVLDANLREDTLAYVAEHVTAPLYADAVSTVKAQRLKGSLPRLHCLKPNALEAEKLTGASRPEQAAAMLVEAGVDRVFLSMGAQGMLAAEKGRQLYLPCEQARVMNTTGAGDAVTAALVWAGIRGMDLEGSLRAALKAGAITTETAEANNPRLAELPGAFV